MKKCTGTGRDWEWCRGEKMGCPGCHHYRKDDTMKIKNINLKWNVLRWDINTKKVTPYNILGYSFAETLAAAIKKKKIVNREQLKEHLKREFMYRYWSKSECEMGIGGLFSTIEEVEKIDMWYQIEMNFDNIIDYIILKMDLFKKKEK